MMYSRPIGNSLWDVLTDRHTHVASCNTLAFSLETKVINSNNNGRQIFYDIRNNFKNATIFLQVAIPRHCQMIRCRRHHRPPAVDQFLQQRAPLELLQNLAQNRQFVPQCLWLQMPAEIGVYSILKLLMINVYMYKWLITIIRRFVDFVIFRMRIYFIFNLTSKKLWQGTKIPVRKPNYIKFP